MHLVDYKVRVVNAEAGTAARVRVVIESRDDDDVWGTVGVSENVIEASWLALVDASSTSCSRTRRVIKQAASEALGTAIRSTQPAVASPAPSEGRVNTIMATELPKQYDPQDAQQPLARVLGRARLLPRRPDPSREAVHASSSRRRT